MSNKLVDLNYNSLFEKDNANDIIDSDNGALNLPKFFRKQVDWQIIGKTGNKTKSLKEFISRRNDACYLVEEFLENRHCAHKHQISEFIEEDGTITVGPGDLVNIESDSYVETPNIITSWY